MKHRRIRMGLRRLALLLVVTGSACGQAGGGGTIPPDSGERPAVQEQEHKQEVAPFQSSRERQLVILFRSLLEMDGVPELHFSAQEAEALLPAVSQAVEKGALGPQDLTRVLDRLTPGQRAYYNGVKERMERRPPPPGKPLEEEERRQLLEDFRHRHGGEEPPAGREVREGSTRQETFPR
ncbi:hypothetical protein N6H14_29940 [Paenibacillus sp. CC-CFT747]|nr:hypothetical protein N6H14_29940 [Paenibacillus sp. CC-CFT747]